MIGQQLRHLQRNVASIDGLISCGASLLAAGKHWYLTLLLVSEMVRQQRILYHADTRSIKDRIVSLTQPHLRSIVRGKARSNVESGAKVSISVTGGGFAFLDRLSWDPYNEGEDHKAQVQAYRGRYGYFPKVVCADQIYRIRTNRAFCQRLGIRLSGPGLGRPNNDPVIFADELKVTLEDQRRRHAVEGKIGHSKRRFGPGLIRETLPNTSGCTIAMNLLEMNQVKLLELLFVLFWLLAVEVF